MPEHFITTRSPAMGHRERVETELILWGAKDIRHIASQSVIEWVFICPGHREEEYKAFVAKLNSIGNLEVTDQTFYRTRKLR